MTQTSIQAYQEIQEDGTMGKQMHIVYCCIAANQPVSDLRISKITGLSINAVTARRNQLVKDDKVRCWGVRPSETGKRVQVWGLK